MTTLHTPKKIKVKVYEEVKLPLTPYGTVDLWKLTVDSLARSLLERESIMWIDNKGINTPYIVSWVNI